MGRGTLGDVFEKTPPKTPQKLLNDIANSVQFKGYSKQKIL